MPPASPSFHLRKVSVAADRPVLSDGRRRSLSPLASHRRSVTAMSSPESDAGQTSSRILPLQVQGEAPPMFRPRRFRRAVGSPTHSSRSRKAAAGTSTRYDSTYPSHSHRPMKFSQIIFILSLKNPTPTRSTVELMIKVLKEVGFPFKIIFNKVDLAEPEEIEAWRSLVKNWTGTEPHFMSLTSYLGVSKMDELLMGGSSLVVGPRNVGKTTLLQYIGENLRGGHIDLLLLQKKVDKWTGKGGDLTLLMMQSKQQSGLRAYCIDLYESIRPIGPPFVARSRTWVVREMLEKNTPDLADLVPLILSSIKAEEHLYFMQGSAKERGWWEQRKQNGFKSFLEGTVPVGQDEFVDDLVRCLYEHCIRPSVQSASLLQDIHGIVLQSTSLLKSLAHNPSFLTVCLLLIMVGKESVGICSARLIRDLCEAHTECQILVGNLGGFFCIAEMLLYGSADARETALTTLSALVGSEDNESKFLISGIPELVTDSLLEDGEKVFPPVSKIIMAIGSSELCWNRFFVAAHDKLRDMSSLYNVVMQALIIAKHMEELKVEYLEGYPFMTETTELWEGFRKEYKEKHPSVKEDSVIGEAGGDRWKSISDAEKAPFVAKAEKLKAEYTKKMDSYNNKLSGGPAMSGDSDKPKSEVNDKDEGSVEGDK